MVGDYLGRVKRMKKSKDENGGGGVLYSRYEYVMEGYGGIGRWLKREKCRRTMSLHGGFMYKSVD